METAARYRIKRLSFRDQQNSLYHLHSIKEITSDECKTLTKISTRNFSQQFSQISARFGHDETRKPANSSLHKQLFA